MIKQLSEQTAEQLCAQQVITSLPDCIKQLIDNSIDAGSTYIKVTLTEYGKQRVEVIDNGFGINDFDFLGKKGSTSKNKGNDQFNYLGFRGEAIHSIGRVSQEMKIQSKSSVDGFRRTFNVNTLDLQVFKQERLCHGQFNFQVANKQSSKSTGSKVTIEGIFKNLPVRQIQLQSKCKQFLKKTNEIIKEFCLIYPQIQFLFINSREGKQEIIIETSAHKTFSRLTWLERIKEMDERIGNSLIYVQSELFEGYVLNKIESGSSRQNNFIKKHYHYLFLNRRPIDVVTAIQNTLNEVYKKYNNNTKFAFLINLKLDHSKIDINLTPNKREVFIRKEVLEKIVKDLREQIVEKVIEEIPTLTGFEDKKKGTQSQLLVNSQPVNDGAEKKEMGQRKTISFLTQRTEEDIKPSANKTEQKTDFSNNRGDDKFASFRQSMNVARNSMQVQPQSKKQLPLSKSKPMSDLPQLEKVNVDMNKLKEQLNNRLTQNIGIIKRTSTLPSSSLGLASEPVNSMELQQIRKENQEKKVREEQQDAKRRVEFLKEVKIEYSEEDQNKTTKPVNEKYKSRDSASARKAKDNLSSLNEESQYKQNHSQKDEDEVEEIGCCKEKPKQASDKQLEERIKAKINIDMSQIFVKFHNKNKEKSEDIIQEKANLAFFDQQLPQQQQQHQQQVQALEQSPEQAPLQQPIMIDGKGNATTKPIKKQNFKDFEVIGQFNMGFILCLFNHQYFLVDQHAASEKFHYQKFLRQSTNLQSIRSQQKQEITGIQADEIEDCKNLLKQAGFYFKISNRNYLQLQRCPIFYGGRLGLQYFWQIVEQKKELHRIGKFTAMCAMKACKTAVVVGNVLRYGEMRQIVNNLADLESPWNCPHGRPTLVQLGRRETFRGKVTPIRTVKNYDL